MRWKKDDEPVGGETYLDDGGTHLTVALAAQDSPTIEPVPEAEQWYGGGKVSITVIRRPNASSSHWS